MRYNGGAVADPVQHRHGLGSHAADRRASGRRHDLIHSADVGCDPGDLCTGKRQATDRMTAFWGKRSPLAFFGRQDLLFQTRTLTGAWSAASRLRSPPWAAVEAIWACASSAVAEETKRPQFLSRGWRRAKSRNMRAKAMRSRRLCAAYAIKAQARRAVRVADGERAAEKTVKRSLNRDGRFYRRMRLVIFQGEILILEAENILHGGIEAHHRQGIGQPRQLLARLVQVIEIKMGVAKGMNEF